MARKYVLHIASGKALSLAAFEADRAIAEGRAFELDAEQVRAHIDHAHATAGCYR